MSWMLWWEGLVRWYRYHEHPPLRLTWSQTKGRARTKYDYISAHHNVSLMNGISGCLPWCPLFHMRFPFLVGQSPSLATVCLLKPKRPAKPKWRDQLLCVRRAIVTIHSKYASSMCWVHSGLGVLTLPYVPVPVSVSIHVYHTNCDRAHVMSFYCNHDRSASTCSTS